MRKQKLRKKYNRDGRSARFVVVARLGRV